MLYTGTTYARGRRSVSKPDLVFYDKNELPDDPEVYVASDHAVGTDKTRNINVFVSGWRRVDDIYLLIAGGKKIGEKL